ncbi:disulfide isomerase-like protein [Geopyxis carbonaria]|nr:disulfide isomerase-like protein [Geopyxis carbonaria]
MKVFGAFLSIASLAVATASNVITLTPKNFDDVIMKSGKPALVEFFAPWCGHCKKLAPVWEELADSYAGRKDHITIAKVDCDEHKSIGKRFGIQGFPTLKYFDGKGSDPIPYESGRDTESFQKFIAEQAGVKAKVKKALPSNVVVLTDSNFASVVNGAKNVLVEFYAPWCGHCKSLAPIYETLARNFASEEDLIIAKFDADAANGKETAMKMGITGFPTLKWFPKGSTEPTAYEGARNEAAFVKFLNEHAGTKRAVGGGLNELAGRIAEFDAHIKSIVKGEATTLEAAAAEIKKLAAESKEASAAYYVKALEKLSANEGYVEKELKRLQGLLSKGGLAPSKVDEISIKKNILSLFYAQDEAPKDEL